jgi:hypothetical protein
MPDPAVPLFLASQAAAVAALAATAYVLGRLLTRRLPLAPGIERAAVAATVGLAALAHLALFLGLAGRLTRPALAATLAAVHLVSIRSWRDLAADARAAARAAPSAGPALAAALLLVAPLFLLALYPPTAFDSTLYHLPFARAFAASGGLPFLPHLRFPVFPQLQELLFTGMLLLDRDVGAQLVELLATLLTAALLVGWAGGAEREGTGRAAGGAGWLAAAVFLGSPIVVGVGTTAYVEPGLTLFAAAAFYAAWRYRESGERGWVALAAACGGAAAASKYLGLCILAIAGGAIALARPAAGGVDGRGDGARRRRASDLLLFAAAALAVLLPWYGRIVHHTGNPVFPFLSGIFGPSPWRPPVDGAPEMPHAGLAALLRLPWDVYFARQRAGSEPPFSPAYLLALPLLLAAARHDRRVRWGLGIALAAVLFYPAVPHDARYLLPALPPLSWALGLALAAFRPLAARPRRLAAAALLLLAPAWGYAVYRLVRQGPVPATGAARERYLASRLPVYPAVAALNRRCGDRYTVYGFFAENMRYYAAGTFLGDWNGPERFGEVFPLLGDPDALADRLARFGAGLALVPRAQTAFAVPASPAWRRRFRPVYSDAAAEVFAVVDGGQPASAACQR